MKFDMTNVQNYDEKQESQNNNISLARTLYEYLQSDVEAKRMYYGWLSQGDEVITITKGIHQTPTDRKHFTFRVGSKTFHAYTRLDKLFEFKGTDGLVKSCNAMKVHRRTAAW